MIYPPGAAHYWMAAFSQRLLDQYDVALQQKSKLPSYYLPKAAGVCSKGSAEIRPVIGSGGELTVAKAEPKDRCRQRKIILSQLSFLQRKTSKENRRVGRRRRGSPLAAIVLLPITIMAAGIAASA